jgi:isoquinoline 1-oxidoreductase alpha subunit
MAALVVNGLPHVVEVAPDTPLLWVLREQLRLTAAKYGCGIGACGACTVLLGNEPVRACITPVSVAEGKEIRTAEGLDESHPVVAAWIAEEVPQCGFCQPAQVLTAVALLEHTPRPDDQAINRAFSGNLCRCGTYPRIRRAVKRAAENDSHSAGSSAQADPRQELDSRESSTGA